MNNRDKLPTKDGLLKIHCFINGFYVPVANCKVIIVESNSNFDNLKRIFRGSTNDNGFIDDIELDAPSISFSYSLGDIPYGIYNIGISKPGFNNLMIKGVQIFPKVKSLQVCYLNEAIGTTKTETIIIPQHKQITGSDSKVQGAIKKTDDYYCDPQLISDLVAQSQYNSGNTRVLSKVVAPSTIRVHAGSPFDKSAPNYTVPFVQYIKNVAASELYSTWDSNTLSANIYCIVSFALNRIFTEWYPSHGDTFDITNDTPCVL